jgi:hypothetical protein
MANRLGPQMLQLVIDIVSELEGIRLDLKNDRPWVGFHALKKTMTNCDSTTKHHELLKNENKGNANT